MKTHVSLFTGSGIPCLAAKNAGFETVAVCESDPACQYALRKLWPEAILFEDVKTADWSKVTGPIDLLDAGVPCQPVSTAGKQLGDKDERWLWPATIRAVRALMPRFVVFENPCAIILHGLERIVAEMETLGYDFLPKDEAGNFTPLVVGAWNVGAPHRRNRVWIVGKFSDAASGGQRTDGPARGGERYVDECGESVANSSRQSRQQRAERDGVGERGEQLGDAARDNERRNAKSRVNGQRQSPGGSSGDECEIVAIPECGIGRSKRRTRRTEELQPDGDAIGRSQDDGGSGGSGSHGQLGDSKRDGLQSSGRAATEVSSQRCNGTLSDEEIYGDCRFGGSDEFGFDFIDGSGPVSEEVECGLADAIGGDSGSGSNQPQREENQRTPFRWPSRPGQPQHDWEAPRLTQCGLGVSTSGMGQRLLREAFGIAEGIRDDTLDRVAEKIEKIAATRSNKSGLRMAGNGWCQPVAEMIFQWIAEQIED